MAWAPGHKRMSELPPNWKQIRRRVLARDHHTCVMCGAPANQVDHIVRGQDHSLGNLRSLCEHCHMVRTGRDGGSTPRRTRTRARPEPKHPGML